MEYNYSRQKDNKLAIKEKTQINLVRYDEIIYLECYGNLIFVYHMTDKKPYSYTNSLAHLESELSEFGFLRIDHNKLINMSHVLNLNAKNHCVELTNDIILKVSRRKWRGCRNYFTV